MQQKWNQNFDGEPMTDIPQKFLNAGCDVYMVMQLRHDEKIFDERFASMRELNHRGKTPDRDHYEVTYYADLPAMWQDVPNNEILEELFQMFNLSRPQDFEGHSLSVSDVIALKRNGEVSVHYVDSIGFKELPGFLDTKPERPSVLMNLREKCDAPECNPTVCRKARDEVFAYPDQRCSVSPHTFVDGGRVIMKDRLKEHMEGWRFCEKCGMKLYQKIDGCSGTIHLKCHRCNTLLRIDLSFRRKK